MNKRERETIENVLSLFRGRCGHQWVGASDGYFGCPLCGDADGYRHLVAQETIAVQVEDYGCAWDDLAKLAAKAWKAQEATP